ncbi:NADPH-dependent FMN reductase [Haloprofundus salilacus]|uniref:NADPH-dependent FMN reductase n=1 Tax=Haloprofundus salilacus TaxID=2876190 RepID=UPI001CCA8ED3|nr:NADPH-dependent FMN reductase [Haloprofundus salilacus]
MSSLGRASRSSGDAQPHVVAVCGSRREGSHTRRALQEALASVEAAGGTTELLDLAELDLPPLNTDVKEAGDGDVVRRMIREADAVILGTPMYHGSYSGVLKNALDYCGFTEFEDTTVGLLVVSGGPFPTPALTHLRDVCRSLNAWALPYQAAVPQAGTAFDEDGFTDEGLRERVRTLGVRAVEYAAIEPREVRAAQLREVN